MRLQCNTCGGTFDDVLPDGMRYFHACPPISAVRVTRGGVPQDVPLTDLQPTDLARVRRGGAELTVPVAALLPDDQRLGDTTLPRPNARDENVDRAKLGDPAKPHTPDDVMKAPGLGVSPAPIVPGP